MILTYGRIAHEALQAAEELAASRPVRVIRLARLYPLNAGAIRSAVDGATRCLIVEEGMRRGGIGEAITAILAESGADVRAKILAAADFVPHGDADSLLAALSLDAAGIIREADF